MNHIVAYWLSDEGTEDAMRSLTAAARGVLLACAMLADKHGLLVFGGPETLSCKIAVFSGLRLKTVKKNVENLHKKGLIGGLGGWMGLGEGACLPQNCVGSPLYSLDSLKPREILKKEEASKKEKTEKTNSRSYSEKEVISEKIASLPKIGKITNDVNLTAETILELYDDLGTDWIVGVLSDIHEWCESKRGLEKLSGKRDGHRFLLGWLRRARRNPKPKIIIGEDGDFSDINF